MSFDTAVFNFIYGLSGHLWVVDWFGVFFAEYFGYFLFPFVFALIIKEKDWRKRFLFFSCVILSSLLARGIIAESVKFFYARPRPFSALGIIPLITDVSNGSMPSGHAALFFALGFSVFYFNKLWGWRFLAAAAIIGFFRIFAGIHWPSDILAGALIGIASAYLIKRILPDFEAASEVVESVDFKKNKGA